MTLNKLMLQNPAEKYQFVVVTSDDNGLVDKENQGALSWLMNFIRDKTNPYNHEKSTSFDGKPVRFAFYVTARYGLRRGFEDKDSVLVAWRSLYDNGHELGNHSTEHLMTVRKTKSGTWEDVYFEGACYSKKEWFEKEFSPCHELLTGDALKIPESSLYGWRTPRFSEWNNNLFQLLEEHNYLYDSSLEYFSETGKDFLWPHRLDNGSPLYPNIDRFPNLWELPIYNLIFPDDVRNKLTEEKKHDLVTVDLSFFLSKEKGGLELNGDDYFQALKYTLQQRLEGNKCPFIVNLHSDIYSVRRDKDCPTTTARERQLAIENFIEYALKIPEVRFITPVNLIKWIKNKAEYFRKE